MAKIFKTAFDEVVTNHISTTTKELNFDSFTECGTYQIYEDMGNGRSCTHQLIVDKSAEGACTTQTRICKGNTSYRCYDSKTEKWSAWTTQGGGNADISELEKKIETKADKGDVYTKKETNTALDKKLDAGTETDYVSNIEFTYALDENYVYQTAQVYDKNGKQTFIEMHRASLTPSKNSTDLITSGAVYKAIGDIDTALENIIAKYGLGGDVI